MIIKKCDVCKNETDALYDKQIATHVDTISGNNCIKQEKLHICRVCIKAINLIELQAQLGWYEENVRESDGTDEPTEQTNDDIDNGDVSDDNNESDNNTNENEQGNSEDAGGTTTGD